MARKHYDILQVKPDSTGEEIQRAYRRLALRYHPDRNPSPDAASQMAAINEAYEAVKGSDQGPGLSPKDTTDAKPPRSDELTASIFGAAHSVIQRHGWTVCHDDGSRVVFEIGKPGIRIMLMERLTMESFLRAARRYGELVAVLAVHIDGPIPANARWTVVDLMHAQRYGAELVEGPCKSLLSGFL